MGTIWVLEIKLKAKRIRKQGSRLCPYLRNRIPGRGNSKGFKEVSVSLTGYKEVKRPMASGVEWMGSERPL